MMTIVLCAGVSHSKQQHSIKKRERSDERSLFFMLYPHATRHAAATRPAPLAAAHSAAAMVYPASGYLAPAP